MGRLALAPSSALLVPLMGWVAPSGMLLVVTFACPVNPTSVAVHHSRFVLSSASQHFAAGEMPRGGLNAAPQSFAQRGLRLGGKRQPHW